MKTTFKKMLCLLLAIAFVFSLAACNKGNTDSAIDLGGDEGWDIETDASGNNGADGTNSTGNTSNATQTGTGNNKPVVQTPVIKDADSLSWKELVAQMPAALRGTTVTVFSWNPPKDVTGAERVISDFTKQTGIKVNWVQGSYDTYDTDLAAKINSGNSPDVIRYRLPDISRMYLTQDVATATGYDFKGDIWDKTVSKYFTVKGKVYGVNLKNTFNKQPTVVSYRQSMIDRYKLDDPYELWKAGEWDFDTFIEICKEFMQETKRSAWMTSAQLDPMWFSGVSLIKFDGEKYTNNLSDKKVIDALRKCVQLRVDDVIPKTTRNNDSFENGTYLFYTDNILSHRKTDFHFATLKDEGDLYCVPFPTGLTDTYYQAYNESEAYGIPKGAKNPQAVYFYLRAYLNKDNYDKNIFFSDKKTLEVYEWCVSQENVHYVIDRQSLPSIVNGSHSGGLESFLNTTPTEANLQTFIDSNTNPTIESAIKSFNATVAKFE